MTTIIQCRCGAVHVELTGEPMAQFFCHCDDCQAVHSAAYVPIAMFPATAVRIASGATKAWKLRHTGRVTCPECGTRLFAEKPELWIRGVCAALLPPGAFKPAFHIQCQYALRPVRDELPHYKAFPARFGGTDELVDW